MTKNDKLIAYSVCKAEHSLDDGLYKNLTLTLKINFKLIVISEGGLVFAASRGVENTKTTIDPKPSEAAFSAAFRTAINTDLKQLVTSYPGKRFVFL